MAQSMMKMPPFAGKRILNIFKWWTLLHFCFHIGKHRSF
jgi:hypothetical protein